MLMMNEILLSSFGGSGENGRNCHCIEVNGKIILLDCGVKREVIDGTVGFYPSLNEEVVSRISCVFLSHCHEDHVASLPLVYHYGYTGKVYATKETIAETKGFIKKWMTFVEKKNGVLPYTEEDLNKIQFEEIQLGNQMVEGYNVTLGRTGHVLGASWYVFDFEGKKVLYTGDMVLNSASLETDIPEKCDAAIMNGAYAGKSLDQKKQYETLLKNVRKTWHDGGSVLLPIPPKGRGIDMTLFLDENLEEGTLYVEEAVITSMNELMKQTAWIKTGSVRGNHDNPAYFNDYPIKHRRWMTIPDYSIVKACGHHILCVGGAISVDRSYRISDPHYHVSKNDEPLARNIYWANEYPVFAVEKLDAISESCAIDTIITHTAPSFCELTSKSGLTNWAIRDEDLMAHVKYERQVIDKILNYLKTKDHPLRHWFYGHFHQSWHQEIDNVQYNMLDIMELRVL